MAAPMHVVLSADDKYAKYLAVTIVSVLSNRAEGDEMVFHVLDDGIRQENRRKIVELVTNHRGFIEFVPVDQQMFSGKVLNITAENHVTLATYYRLLIPSLIKVERCIYMDCDMVCRASLAPLWKTDLEDCIAAAVKDIDEDKQSVRLQLKRYFNAGFLLMNLTAMRIEGIQERFFHFIEQYYDRIVMHDQDVLNWVLHGRIHELDMTWNCQVAKTHKCRETGFYELSRKANILHFIGHRKPWMHGCGAPERNEYWKYRRELPWNKKFWLEKFLSMTS